MPCESLVRTHCRRYVRTRAPKVVVPDARVASTPRPGLGAASRHTEPALDWSTPDREATQRCGCVVALGTRARTQNGHIRNDTRDVPRRISSACNSAICRKKYVASDRACTRVTLQNFHGKEGVDGSSPSEGLINVPANWHITVVCPLNTRTQNGHIRGTRDAARPFATPADTLSQVRSRAHHRGSTCLEAITRCLNRRGRDPLSPERGSAGRAAGRWERSRNRNSSRLRSPPRFSWRVWRRRHLACPPTRRSLEEVTYTSPRDALHASLQ